MGSLGTSFDARIDWKADFKTVEKAQKESRKTKASEWKWAIQTQDRRNW